MDKIVPLSYLFCSPLALALLAASLAEAAAPARNLPPDKGNGAEPATASKLVAGGKVNFDPADVIATTKAEANPDKGQSPPKATGSKVQAEEDAARILKLAKMLAADGLTSKARIVYQKIVAHFPETKAAAEARRLLAAAPARNPPPDKGDGAEPANASKLVATLVARGDAAQAKDKNAAYLAYSFAARYAPDDDSLKDKIKALGPQGLLLTQAEIDRSQRAIRQAFDEDLVEWPDPAPQVDGLELRILTDRRLVGNLRHTKLGLKGATVNVFLSQPTLTVAQARSVLGKPSAERKTRRGSAVLTYGRLRLIGGSSNIIALVVFHPDLGGKVNLDPADVIAAGEAEAKPDKGQSPPKPTDGKVQAEEEAARKLKLAKMLAADGLTSKARIRFEEIVSKFPETKAAAEARQLLEKPQ